MHVLKTTDLLMPRPASFERFPPERTKKSPAWLQMNKRSRCGGVFFASFRLFFTSYRWTVIKFHFPDRSLKNSSICGAVVS